MNQTQQMPMPTNHKVDAPIWNDLQDTFLRNVEHELRTPLAIIMGYTVQAQRSDWQPLSLTDIVAGVVEAQRAKAVQAGLMLEFHRPPALPQLTGDSRQLRQAVGCLVENAIKFTPAGGWVEVQIEAEAGWVCLTVTDTGIGIEESQLADVFNAFYQVNGSTTRRYGGLGLGLTVARAIIEAHNGQIEVKSRSGYGSQFTIKLPVESSTARGKHPQSKIEPQRILVVDDEQSVALMLQEALKRLPNCEIITTTNGEQALPLFEQQSFDLVITDYNMPGVDGLTLAAHIRRLCPQVPIVMLTGYANDTLRRQAADVSIQRILDKPIEIREIRRVASEMLVENGAL